MQEDKNYCVYIHRNKRTGEIFYIGSGTLERSVSTSGRNNKWKKVVATDGFLVEILHENLDKKSAFQKEYAEFEFLSNIYKLTNSRKPPRLVVEPVELIQSRFIYDETSPTLLRYKTAVYKGRNHSILAALPGDVAGSSKGGRACVSIGNRPYFIHRIVWILNFGAIEECNFIDHIDGNAENNLISNLRSISHKENTRNRKIASTNKSGVSGVSLVNYKGNPVRWCSEYRALNGKRISKYFNIKKHGNEEAFRLACEYRAQKIRELNEQGAGYTERHGT